MDIIDSLDESGIEGNVVSCYIILSIYLKIKIRSCRATRIRFISRPPQPSPNILHDCKLHEPSRHHNVSWRVNGL